MVEIQRKWVYLEPIFGRGALPQEASRFSRVDGEFRIVLSGNSASISLLVLSKKIYDPVCVFPYTYDWAGFF